MPRRVRAFFSQNTHDKKPEHYVLFGTEKAIVSVISRVSNIILPKSGRMRPKMSGQAGVATTHHTKERIFHLESIVFDSALSNAENMRRIFNMIRLAEEDARKKGVEKLITSWTHVRPTFAKKFGFTVVKEVNRKGESIYQYEKVLG